jgi:hypothetical protein
LAAAAGDHGSEAEQLAAINKVEVPAFIRSSRPALALLAFSGALAAVPHIKEYRTQRALESARSRALTLSAPKIGDFAVDSRALGLPVYEGTMCKSDQDCPRGRDLRAWGLRGNGPPPAAALAVVAAGTAA